MATKLNECIGRTPPVDPNARLDEFGYRRIDGDRFTSREWMDLEWKNMWRRVWNMACRESDLPEPGDYYVCEFGKESLIFIRQQDGSIRGFYNVCQHRGNLLALGGEGCGHSTFLQCGYHGWEWNIDGSVKHVSDLETFPQYADGIPEGDLDMSGFEVDTWAGWVWFKLDEGGESLQDFLGVVPAHLDPYEIDRWVIADYKTFEWPCNWKAACDAFNESYHFQTLHAQMMQWSNGIAEIELHGIHSRMVNQYGTVDPRHDDQDNIGDRLARYMSGMGIDAATYDRPPKDFRLTVQEMKRSIQDQTHFAYRNLNDDQLSDTYHYTIFPNVSWNVFPEGINGFRYRPHPTDPNKCYYDLILMRYVGPNDPEPDYTHRTFSIDELPNTYSEVMDLEMDVIVSEVLEQDGSNLGPVQRGLASDGFRGMVLCDQEARVRQFHELVEDYVMGRR